MSSRLANTMFQGRSSDTLVAKDAYNVSTAVEGDSFHVAQWELEQGMLEHIQTNPESVGDMLVQLNEAEGKGLSPSEKLDIGLKNLGTSLPSVFGTMSGVLKNKIAGQIAANHGKGAGDMVHVLYKNASTLVKGANIKDTQSALDFISELADGNQLVKALDLETEFLIFGAVTETLVGLGLIDLMDDVLANIDSEEVKRRALRAAARQAIYSSDLKTLNKILDQITLEEFLEDNPNAVIDILALFTFRDGDTPGKRPALLALLISTLTRIDVWWNHKVIMGEVRYKLEPYNAASDDARVLLMMEEPHRQLCMTAEHYGPSSVNEIISTLYPDAYVD